MGRILGAVAVGLMSAAALAASAPAELPERAPVDAFLSRGDAKPLPDVSRLSVRAQAALSQAHITATESRLGVPTFLFSGRSPQSRSFKAMGLSAEQVARRVLFDHAELYRGDGARWAEAPLIGLHELHDGGAVIATFGQSLGGVRVFRDEVKVIMTAEYELVAVSGYLTPARRVLGEFRLAPEAAIDSAYQSLAGRPLAFGALRSLGKSSGAERFAVEGERTPARVKPVYFALPEGLVPGLYIELEVTHAPGNAEYFSFVVSAEDGRLLYRKNLTAYDTYAYRVWATNDFIPQDGPHGNAATPHPTGLPDGHVEPYVPMSLITLPHAGLATNDDWLGANATQTQGNNVFAYIDVTRPSGFATGDLSPSPTSANTFDRLYDPNVGPDANPTQRLAAATQLFFDNNFFHDWFYDRGFDERSGNAQANNFGRGGQGGDVLLAEGQDYSGRSNANMSTPSDGASPRMQMYIFDATSTAKATIVGTPPQDLIVGTAPFGPQSFNVTAEVVLVDDGDTAGGSTTSDGCTGNYVRPVAGKIALVDRGLCQFVTKVQVAQANGAIGIIIADNRVSQTPPDLAGSGTTTIPALSVTQAVGTQLRSRITGGPTQLSMVRAATVDRDGTLDNAIVAHEWGHYISNRLVGDANGLANNQAYGMGEGWGDFHALIMVVKAEDILVPANANWAGVYGLAGYTSAGTDPNGYYFGIRRLPYSTDFAKNALTFKHIQNGVQLPANVPTAFGQSGAQNAESHNTGEVWANVLWEAYAALLRDTGRLTFTQAQDRMLRYLVGAYKATPMMPTILEGRDALLAVAAAADPADFSALWGAFARRGMGMLARGPARDSRDNRPVTESFDVGNALSISGLALNDAVLNCDADGNLDNDETGLLTITVRNIGVGMLTQSTATVTTTTPGVTFPQGATVNLPATAPFATSQATVQVALAGVSGVSGVELSVQVTDPSLVGTTTVSRVGQFRVNYDVMPNGSTIDDVESPSTLWTVGHDASLNTGSDWRIAQSNATTHWWFGPNPSSPADTYLVSPALTASATDPLVVTFSHRYSFERDSRGDYDGGLIEVSTNGTTWTDVGAFTTPGYTGTLSADGANPLGGRQAFVGQSPGYPNFAPVTVSLGTRYAGQTVRLRLRIASDDAAAATGWDVDDIEFKGITNKPFNAVVVDTNRCTNAPPIVSVGPAMTVDEGSLVTLVGSATDPNGDAVTLTWTQSSGALVTLVGGVFTAPQVDSDTLLAFALTATDGKATVGPRMLEVTVRNVNSAPTASAPALLEVKEGEVVSIVGTGADPEGDALTYAWAQVDGPAVMLTGADTDTVGFLAPLVDTDTILTFELVVSDAVSMSSPARVEVVVKNAPPLTVPKEEVGKAAPGGCGCTTGIDGGFALFGLLALLGLKRKR